MTTQLEKTCGNDYSMLGKVLSNVVITSMPILGTLYNSAMSVQFEERLAEIETQLREQCLEIENLKNFVKTDEGYSLFSQCVNGTLVCPNKNRIKHLVSILKNGYTVNTSINTQYQTELTKIISVITDTEIKFLFYIKKYCNETHFTKRTINNSSNDMEFFLDGENDCIGFNDFLNLESADSLLLVHSQFLLLRLKNLCLLNECKTWDDAYYVTILGKELLKCLEDYSFPSKPLKRTSHP